MARRVFVVIAEFVPAQAGAQVKLRAGWPTGRGAELEPCEDRARMLEALETAKAALMAQLDPCRDDAPAIVPANGALARRLRP